ncbi:pilus assembly protein PilI, partial [Escherichia coli]|nr:pilus assembly protein PilI [Escherichia coli]
MPEFFRHLFHKECPHRIFWFKCSRSLSS